MKIKICLLEKKERNLFLLYTNIYMLTCYIKIDGKISASMLFKYTKNETYNFWNKYPNNFIIQKQRSHYYYLITANIYEIYISIQKHIALILFTHNYL